MACQTMFEKYHSTGTYILIEEVNLSTLIIKFGLRILLRFFASTE